MYCCGVAHGLPTLKHMGRFIRELDVCVRWQVAWRGRREKKEAEGRNFIDPFAFLFCLGFFFHAKHTRLGKVDCLFAAGGKSVGTTLLCPDENAFTAPLHCWYTNYFMGSNEFTVTFSSLLFDCAPLTWKHQHGKKIIIIMIINSPVTRRERSCLCLSCL